MKASRVFLTKEYSIAKYPVVNRRTGPLLSIFLVKFYTYKPLLPSEISIIIYLDFSFHFNSKKVLIVSLQSLLKDYGVSVNKN